MSKKAFTLVELLIAMAIIAVLIAIAAYGIALVQRNSRNTQRAQFINDFKVGIEKYYSNYGRYPDTGNICINNSTNKIVMTSPSGSAIGAEIDVPRADFLLPSGNTTQRSSAYCYTKEANGLYSLQYQSESQGSTMWSQQLGTSDNLCESSTLTIGNC